MEAKYFKQPEGFKMTIVPNAIIQEGTSVLHINPKDYEKYKKQWDASTPLKE